MASSIDVGVTSLLREGAGRTEDGDYVVIEDFVVQATFADGTRYQHEVAFVGRTVYSEEGFAGAIHGDYKAADRLAARVAAHLEAGGSLDLARWHEVDPAYGSAAYQRSGIEAERAYADRFDR